MHNIFLDKLVTGWAQVLFVMKLCAKHSQMPQSNFIIVGTFDVYFHFPVTFYIFIFKNYTAHTHTHTYLAFMLLG